MSVNHKRPLSVFAVLVLLCLGIIVNAFRADALVGVRVVGALSSQLGVEAGAAAGERLEAVLPGDASVTMAAARAGSDRHATSPRRGPSGTATPDEPAGAKPESNEAPGGAARPAHARSGHPRSGPSPDGRAHRGTARGSAEGIANARSHGGHAYAYGRHQPGTPTGREAHPGPAHRGTPSGRAEGISNARSHGGHAYAYGRHQPGTPTGHGSPRTHRWPSGHPGLHWGTDRHRSGQRRD